MEYIAVDIGASSGKIIKGRLLKGKAMMETVHRFPNTPLYDGSCLFWDIDRLFEEIVTGLGKAGYADYVSIDTWGVDFVLLDRDRKRLGKAVSYRDKRTERLRSWPDQAYLYSHTGIQKQRFNTVYQLLSIREEHPDILGKAAYMLFIPDYLVYLLTGNMCQEYTFASTTNLLSALDRTWDRSIISSLGLPSHLFGELSEPGFDAGRIRRDIADQIGYRPAVLLAPSHDSASAVIGSPIGCDTLFISSGTWSILGAVTDRPYTGKDAMDANLSNEGGVRGTTRLVKNIMGSWMLQRIAEESGASFDELEEEAMRATPSGIVDVEDDRFLSPENMSNEIEAALGVRCVSRGELAAAVYHSLAEGYRKAHSEIEMITGHRYPRIAIVGGGSRDRFLNQLTADKTGCTVTAGPGEGTAIGNLLYQMISTGELDMDDRNAVLSASSVIEEYRRVNV